MKPTVKKRILLTDRQCHIFLKDMREFGYSNLTFDRVRKIADDLSKGIENTDVIAKIMAKQIDEAAEMTKARKNSPAISNYAGEEPPWYPGPCPTCGHDLDVCNEAAKLLRKHADLEKMNARYQKEYPAGSCNAEDAWAELGRMEREWTNQRNAFLSKFFPEQSEEKKSKEKKKGTPGKRK